MRERLKKHRCTRTILQWFVNTTFYVQPFPTTERYATRKLFRNRLCKNMGNLYTLKCHYLIELKTVLRKEKLLIISFSHTIFKIVCCRCFTMSAVYAGKGDLYTWYSIVDCTVMFGATRLQVRVEMYNPRNGILLHQPPCWLHVRRHWCELSVVPFTIKL